MKLLELLMNHSHYWGVPHVRAADRRVVQTCYGCGAERKVRVDLNPPAPALTGVCHLESYREEREGLREMQPAAHSRSGLNRAA